MSGFSDGRFAVVTLSRSLALMLCSTLLLSACSSTNKTSVAPTEPLANTPPKVATKTLPQMSMTTSIDIFVYANSLREQCFKLQSETGSMLLQFSGDNVASLPAAIEENKQQIKDRLLQQQKKALAVPAHLVKRPELQLSSSAEFLTEMEQSVAQCALSHAGFIEHLLATGEFKQLLSGEIPREQVAGRYKELLLPQLKTMVTLYDFEFQEYQNFDTSFSVQSKLVWLMRQVFMTTLAIANSTLANEPAKPQGYFKAELSNFEVLKAASKRELTMLSGLEFAAAINKGTYLKGKDKNAIKVQPLQRFETIMATFEPDYIELLTELSKDNPNRDRVQQHLMAVVTPLLGNTEATALLRKQYFYNLTTVLGDFRTSKEGSNGKEQ